MNPKQIEMLKFGAGMFVLLLGLSVAAVFALGIRLPWEAPPPPPTEPREFDLTSLNTMVRQYDPERGLVAVQDVSTVVAPARCAMVVDAMDRPTLAGYHYVFNALDPPRGSVKAYPVDTAQLEVLVQDCRAAGAAAATVTRTADDVMSQVRLALLEAEKAKAAEERAKQAPDEDRPAGIEAAFEKVKDGDTGQVNEMIEGLLAK